LLIEKTGLKKVLGTCAVIIISYVVNILSKYVKIVHIQDYITYKLLYWNKPVLNIYPVFMISLFMLSDLPICLLVQYCFRPMDCLK